LVYRGVVAAGPLAFVALVAGWITTEVGRQPWIVYKVMRTTEAVTGAKGIPVGYASSRSSISDWLSRSRGLLTRLGRAPLELPDGAADEFAEVPLV